MWVGPLCGLFSGIFRVVTNKDSVVSGYYEERDSCIMWGPVGVSFRRSLRPYEEAQKGELSSF